MEIRQKLAEEMVTWFTTELDFLSRSYEVYEDTEGFLTRIKFEDACVTSVTLKLLVDMIQSTENYYKSRGKHYNYNFTISIHEDGNESYMILDMNCYEYVTI